MNINCKETIKILLAFYVGIISTFVLIIDFIFLIKDNCVFLKNNLFLIILNAYALFCVGINFYITNKVQKL